MSYVSQVPGEMVVPLRQSDTDGDADVVNVWIHCPQGPLRSQTSGVKGEQLLFGERGETKTR